MAEAGALGGDVARQADAWLPRTTRKSDVFLVSAILAPMALLTLAAAFLPSLPLHVRILSALEAALLAAFCWAWLRHCRAFAAVALGEGFIIVQRRNGGVERYDVPASMRSLQREYGYIWINLREKSSRVRISDYMFGPRDAEAFRVWLLRQGVRIPAGRHDYIEGPPRGDAISRS